MQSPALQHSSAVKRGFTNEPYGYALATLRATRRPVHRNFGLVTERHLNVRTATLKVGHLARGLYATVTTRIHLDWTTSFLSDASIL
jgi:hypothetical protein